MGNAKHAKKTRVLVNQHDLSNYLNQLDTDGSCPQLNSTTFQDTDMTYLGGTPDGKASLKGLYYSKADEVDPLNRNAIDDILSAALGDETSNLIMTVGHADLLVHGDAATLFKAKEQKYSVTAPHDQLVSAMAEMQTVGGFRYGHVLAPLAARTATGTGTALDGGAASSLGFVAHLHSLVASAGDTLDVVIEDSADGSTGWATIGTFSQVAAAATALRLEVSGAVRRYVRARWTIAGNGSESFTFVVTFARNTY